MISSNWVLVRQKKILIRCDSVEKFRLVENRLTEWWTDSCFDVRPSLKKPSHWKSLCTLGDLIVHFVDEFDFASSSDLLLGCFLWYYVCKYDQWNHRFGFPELSFLILHFLACILWHKVCHTSLSSYTWKSMHWMKITTCMLD